MESKVFLIEHEHQLKENRRAINIQKNMLKYAVAVCLF